MESINPTRLLFDSKANYPNDVFKAFEPVRDIYELMVLLTEGLLADGPLTLMEVEAVLHSNYIVSKYMNYLQDHGIVDPKERTVDVNLNSCLTALLAMKIRDKEIYETTKDECVKRCVQLLQLIVEDSRLSKKETLAALTEVKAEATKRIVEVRRRHNKRFVFRDKIERYQDRKAKDENPKDFLTRTYGRYFARGLKPVHLKYEDPDFYNVLHVWCSRNRVDIKSLFVDPGAIAQRSLTDKQKFIKKVREMPEPTS
jgi:hypothetical protein